ncbi:MAG: alpha-hydroxy acid oxidase [Rhodospirillales bacterium]|jgi:isopentenyl diphosphate isomerase/L-lactate dehydrogenase-like FMN-dependent dehydrogenase
MSGNSLRATGYGAPEFLTLQELPERARMNLPDTSWDYLAGGSETETTYLRNRLSLDSLAFRPRVCNDVSKVDVTGKFMGLKRRLPVFLAPIGSLESFASGGGVAAARGAEAFGVDHMVSSVTQPDMETIAGNVNQPTLFQLYVRGDDSFVDDHVKRAVDCGFRAFAVTVDTAHYSRRERDIIKRFLPAGRARGANRTGHNFQMAWNWEKVKRFKDKHSIPLILKGIATAEDAAIAVEHGVDCVYVSNHGGRQLDYGRGAIDVLPEVVNAVGGKAEIAVDGGFCRGTDIVKAMILGANAVGLGRMQGYALAAGGEPGLVRMLELLERECEIALGLLGVTSFAELDQTYITPAPPVLSPGPFAAFPHLKWPRHNEF